MENLDRDILAWIGRHSVDEALTTQLAAAAIDRRDYMRTGFFVYFTLPDHVGAIGDSVRPRCPDIVSAELPYGAGTSLFRKNGRLHYLEIYARGGFFPEQLQAYSLIEPE